MAKATAIAAVYENPFHSAFNSARNLSALAVDFMYGTPQRTRLTVWFAFGLLAVGCALNITNGQAVCSHDALVKL